MSQSAHGEIVLSWQPELQDYRDAFKELRRVRHSREVAGLIAVASVVLAACGVWLDQPTAVGVGVGAVVGIAFVAGPGNALGLRSYWRGSPTLRLPVEVRISPSDGLTSTVPGSSGQYDWSYWGQLLETERIFVLRTGRRKGPFMVLAKRGLGPQTDIATLREVLNDAVSGGTPRPLPSTRV